MKNGKEKGTLGVPALTYIEECNMERRLGRCLENEVDARPLSWGTLCEPVVFDLLPTSYRICSKETIDHETIPYWKGSPDAEKYDEGHTVVDFKCPQTLKSFCQLVDLWTLGGMDAIRFGYEDKSKEINLDKHKDGEKFYWQIVSNGILTKAKHGELIVYCPYQRELDTIRNLAVNSLESRFKWIAFANDEEMPFLNEGGYYKNLNVMRFEIPVVDKIALHERVVEAGKKLIPSPQLITA